MSKVKATADVVGTSVNHLWPAQGASDVRPFSLESWEEYADGSVHQVMVTYDQKVVRTYRDSVECPNAISLYDHALTDREIKEQFDKARGRSVAKVPSKEQILNRFIQ